MKACIVGAIGAGLACFVAASPVEAGPKFKSQGTAAWYKIGKRTANGERFNPNGLTAAHRTLPFGTNVRVTHTGNGKSVVVRINDRGPFAGGHIIDLSLGAAKVIGLHLSGIAQVRLEVLDWAAGTKTVAVPKPKPVREAASVPAAAAVSELVTAAEPPRRTVADRFGQTSR